VPKAIREQTGKGPGHTVEVVVWKDEEARTLEVPAQFENLMKKEGLLPVFKKLSYTHRKEYCRSISSVATSSLSQVFGQTHNSSPLEYPWVVLIMVVRQFWSGLFQPALARRAYFWFIFWAFPRLLVPVPSHFDRR
jgi:hypothetical protein